jgi:hypothetical protein
MCVEQDAVFLCVGFGSAVSERLYARCPPPPPLDQCIRRTPLDSCCQAGDSKLVEKLIDDGADVNNVDVSAALII